MGKKKGNQPSAKLPMSETVTDVDEARGEVEEGEIEDVEGAEERLDKEADGKEVRSGSEGVFSNRSSMERGWMLVKWYWK